MSLRPVNRPSEGHQPRALVNRRSRNWLLLTGGIFGSAGLFGIILLAPAIRAPLPLAFLGMLVFLGGGFLLVSSKTPLSVKFEEEALILRHIVRRKTIPRNEITMVEYRLLTSQAQKPLDERYYGVSVWSGRRRRADVSLDGPIADQLMTWFDPTRSILRIYEGRRVIEERKLKPETP